MRVATKKKCRICKTIFRPFNTTDIVCSIKCAIEESRRTIARKARDTAQQQKRERREAKIRLRSRRDWLKIARDAFNAYVRERDRFKPCISCDFYSDVEVIGGTFDCGHYRTVGAAPQLQFDEANAHKQCKTCNSGVWRRGSKVIVAHDPERAITIHAQYRVRLIARIGTKEVERLENDNSVRRFTAEELQQIAATFKLKLRELRKHRSQLDVSSDDVKIGA